MIRMYVVEVVTIFMIKINLRNPFVPQIGSKYFPCHKNNKLFNNN